MCAKRAGPRPRDSICGRLTCTRPVRMAWIRVMIWLPCERPGARRANERCMRQQLMVVGAVVSFQAATLIAQSQLGTIRLLVRALDKPVDKAEVLVAGARRETDASG